MQYKQLASQVGRIMIAAKSTTKSPTAKSTHLTRIPPWESHYESDEPAIPSRGPGAVQHGDEKRGRRSTRFADLNIGATAEFLGITKAHLTKVLNGDARSSMELGQRLADILGKDLIYVAALYNNKKVSGVAVKPRRKGN